MPWFFPWSESLKKRICRYLLQRYLGQFLTEKLSLDQLNVDLYSGKGKIDEVFLDVEALNELGEKYSLPFEIVDGFITSVSVSIPWSLLLTQSSQVEVTGLMLTLQPKERNQSVSLMGSVLGSMMSSLQIAQECLKEPSLEDLRETELGQGGGQPFEGLELFAQTIDTVFRRVRVSLTETVVRLEQLHEIGHSGVAMELRIKHLEYFDQGGMEEIFSDGLPEQQQLPTESFSTKMFRLEGVTFYTDEFHFRNTSINRSTNSSSGFKTPERPGNSSPDFLEGDQKTGGGSSSSTQSSSKPSSETDAMGDPILIAKLPGFQEIRVKVKQDDKLIGPQLELELSLGLFPCLLGPSQLHLLLELLQSLKRQVKPKSRRQALNKPMGQEELQLVEKELQFHLTGDGPTGKSLRGHQGWSTHSEASMDDFHPMASGGGQRKHVLDMDSSFGSHYSVESAATDLLTDNLTVKLSCSSFCFFLVQDEPSFSSSSHPPLPRVDESSSVVDTPQVLAENFFQRFLDTFQSQSLRNFKDLRQKFDAICPLNHFRLLCSPVVVSGFQKSSSSSTSNSFALTIANLELLECLYGKGEEQKAVSYTELLSFPDSLPTHCRDGTVSCAVKINYTYEERLFQGFQEPHTALSLQFGPVKCEVDLTVLDRIQVLLRPNGTIGQRGLTMMRKRPMGRNNEDEEEDSRSHKVDFNVKSPFAVFHIRFPVPDLRPAHNLERMPWWVKNVRPEILIIEMQEVTFSRAWDLSQQGSSPSKFELQCKDAHGLLQLSPESPPVSFARVSVDPKADKLSTEHGFDWPRLVVKLSPLETPSVLEENQVLDEDLSDPCQQSTFSHMNTFGRESSPFSSRKIVYDRTSPAEAAGSHQQQYTSLGDITDQVVMPSDREEMLAFVDKTVSHCLIGVDISIPSFSLLLPSKDFYELLYNRISNDLAYWEPPGQTPPSFSYQEHQLDSGGWTNGMHHLQRESNHFEAFSACKSGAQYDSNSESDDEGESYFSVPNSSLGWSKSKRRSPLIYAQSNLTLNVHVGQGKLVFCSPLAGLDASKLLEDYQGEFQINLESGSFFFVSGHNGEPGLTYACLSLRNGSLYHSGCVLSQLPPKTLEPALLLPPDHLQATVFSSESGVLPNNSGLKEKDIFSLVIRTGVNQTQGMKTVKVALGLQGVTLRHRMASSGQSWLSQLLDFFDVANHPIVGYSPLPVVTELHFHLHSCAVDYRPLFLPLRAMVTMENFSVSSNLAAHIPTSLLRIISEELSLHVSNQMESERVKLRENYVKVLDTGLFDVTLRMSDGKDPSVPIHDLRATNNTVHIHTCADSCRALQELIGYLAADGDLQNNDKETFYDASEEPYSISTDKSEPSTLVNRMMMDAMKESKEPDPNGYAAEDEEETDDRYMQKSRSESDLVEEAEGYESFCILEDDMGCGILPASGEPQVRQLNPDPFRLVENHFSRPIGRSDHLKAPPHYPSPTRRYTLREMSLVWHLYGGNDFPIEKGKGSEQSPKKVSLVLPNQKPWDPMEGSLDLSSDSVSFSLKKPPVSLPHESVWANLPGTTQPEGSEEGGRIRTTMSGPKGRSSQILVELQMNKLRFQHEKFPSSSDYSSRQVLLIQDLEIRDRLFTSAINKFLYQYSSETLPRQTHANMVQVKAVHSRQDPVSRNSECSLRVSLKPLRLNIDQDTLLFLCNFFGTLFSSEVNPEDLPAVGTTETLMNTTSSIGRSVDSNSSTTSSQLGGQPIYFRSFVFSPEVPIQLDYHGKRVDMEQGALAGLLMGLGQLNRCKIILKRISHRHGLLGVERLLAFVLNEWLQDIRKTQLPSLLGGLGPMNSFVQLFQGMRDLLWLPIEQYRRDGRIMRGLQRGANSFTTSTTMAFLELTNQMVQMIQGAAEFAYDMVSPGPSVKSRSQVVHKKWHLNTEPMDIREGVANAYHVVREGIGDTARTIARVTAEEHEHKGVPGAVGGVLRQIPPIMMKPIILATEATSNVLGGVRNQLVPDARREAVEKWRGRRTQ